MNPLLSAIEDFKRRAVIKPHSVGLREDQGFNPEQRTISIDDLDFDQELVSDCLSPEELLMRLEEEDLWHNIWTG